MPEDPTISFDGYVKCGDVPIAGAWVEWHCNCEFSEGAYTDSNGYYKILGSSHIRHNANGAAGKEGYIGQGIFLDPVTDFPAHVDFSLAEESE